MPLSPAFRPSRCSFGLPVTHDFTLDSRGLLSALAAILLTCPSFSPAQQSQGTPQPLLDLGSARQATPTPLPQGVTLNEPAQDPAEDPLRLIRELRAWRRENPAPMEPEPPPPLVDPSISLPEPSILPTPTPRPTTDATITADQINGWFNSATEIAGQIRAAENAGQSQSEATQVLRARAAALFQQVWEADPENVHGRSDLAYIRWCSFTVTKNDEGLRRIALAQIRQFAERFPNSQHGDRAQFVEAVLLEDLGRVEEARRLFEEFPTNFPQSRLLDTAASELRRLRGSPLTSNRATPQTRSGASPRPAAATPRPSTPRATATPAANRTQSASSRATPQATPRQAPRRNVSAYDLQQTPTTSARPRTTPRATPRTTPRSTPRP